MPFHPLLYSARLGGHFENFSKCQKICFCPFMIIAITITFTFELLILPFRWCYHSVKYWYAVDVEEHEWVYHS